MADRRKFRGRSGVNVGGLLSGISGDGGGIEEDPEAVADVAAETPYWDDTFDANNVLRYKPSSGIKDFLSGGKSSAMASKYNADANASEVANRINREDATTLFNRKLEEDDHRLDNQLKGNRLEYDDRIKRLARSLENESVGNYLVGEDDAPLEEFMQEAQANVNNYGDQSKIHGFLGAPLQASNIESEIAARDKQTAKEPDRFEVLANGTTFDKKNSLLRVPYTPDPTKPGETRFKTYDLTTGQEIFDKVNPVATTNNPKPAKPIKSKGDGILGAIKGTISNITDDNDIDWNALNPLTPSTEELNAQREAAPRFDAAPIPTYTQPAENIDDALKAYLNTDSAKALELLRQKKIKGIKAPLRTY